MRNLQCKKGRERSQQNHLRERWPTKYTHYKSRRPIGFQGTQYLLTNRFARQLLTTLASTYMTSESLDAFKSGVGGFDVGGFDFPICSIHRAMRMDLMLV